MADVVGLAVAQFAPTADESANLDVIASMTATAVARGAGVVLFPEYSSYFVDPFDESLRTHAQAVPGPFTAALSRLAGAHGVTIVAGLLEAADGHRVRNTVVAVDATGIRAQYRKLHLYDAFGFTESDVVCPGELVEPATFEVDGITIGLQTCYDVRFPESMRRVVDAGAQVVALPAQWIPGPLKEDHWSTLVRARAIENTVYLAAADQAGPLGAGNSMVVDPMGVVLASLGDTPGIATGTVSAARIAEIRRRNPALELRRLR